MNLRPVSLPDGVSGSLFLCHMLGRHEPVQSAFEVVRAHGVDDVISLASHSEIQEKSPDYASAIDQGDVPFTLRWSPVPDFGIPEDPTRFADTVRDVVTLLHDGRNVLVHCGAGKGRTGMFASCVLVAFGIGRREAVATVASAGSGAETAEQREWVEKFASASAPE